MKKYIFAVLCAMALVACTTQSTTNGTPAKAAVTVQSAQQVAAQVCPPIETALTGLQALAGLSVNASAAINTAIPVVNGVCAASATINLASLQTLQQTALPAILSAIKASAMSVEQQDAVILDITAANLVLTGFVQAQQNLAANTTSVTSALPSTPTSK